MKINVDNNLIKKVLKNELTGDDTKELVTKVYAAPLITMLVLAVVDIYYWIVNPGPGMILPTALLAVVFAWCFWRMYRASFKARKVYTAMVDKYGMAILAVQMQDPETEVFYINESYTESYSFVTPDFLIITHAGIYPWADIQEMQMEKWIVNEDSIGRMPAESRETLRNTYKIKLKLRDGSKHKHPIALYGKDVEVFEKLAKGKMA